MFCSQCGHENIKESRFCNSCGAPLRDNSGPYTGNLANNTQNKSSDGPVFAILGWVFNAISILFVPILFAAGGVIFGYLHRRVNQTHGTIIMIAGVACGLFGVLLGIAFSLY